MPTLGAPLDFAKLEGRNLRAHQLGAAPSSPVTGQLYYNTADNTLYWFDGTTWVSTRASIPPDATASVKGIVQLAGDLAGTAASPQIAAGAVTDAEVAIANKDGAAATYSMRRLGGTAGMAMPGDQPINSAAVAPTGSLNMNNQKIITLTDPTNPQDAATKAYVDAVAQGLDIKSSVKAASTVNLTLSATQTVDGIALIANDRCLVKNQTTPSQNGIYSVQAGAWTRVTDMDTWAEVPSAFVFVEQGTTLADTAWVCTADAGGTLNTTSITWTQFGAATSYTWGAGLLATGNTIDVGGTANRITASTDTIDIAATYVGQTSITTLGVIGSGTWQGTPVGVAYGGTGSATPAAARTALSAAGYYNNGAVHGAGTTITITAATHGLRASRGLLVQVQDNTTGAVELPDISVAANGDVTVTYAASVTANTKLVTVVG